jgi:hypothetical protein
MEYRSQVKELKYILLIILLGGLMTIIGLEFYPSKLILASDKWITGAVIVFSAFTYFYYAKTNYDFELTGSTLIVRNRFPLMRREYQYTLKKIEKISFQDDSLINLISEYKYVLIQYRDESLQVKQYKFHCHGLEYDCNGENTNLPTYDDLYLMLKSKGIKIEWIKKNNERPTSAKSTTGPLQRNVDT